MQLLYRLFVFMILSSNCLLLSVARGKGRKGKTSTKIPHSQPVPVTIGIQPTIEPSITKLEVSKEFQLIFSRFLFRIQHWRDYSTALHPVQSDTVRNFASSLAQFRLPVIFNNLTDSSAQAPDSTRTLSFYKFSAGAAVLVLPRHISKYTRTTTLRLKTAFSEMRQEELNRHPIVFLTAASGRKQLLDFLRNRPLFFSMNVRLLFYDNILSLYCEHCRPVQVIPPDRETILGVNRPSASVLAGTLVSCLGYQRLERCRFSSRRTAYYTRLCAVAALSAKFNFTATYAASLASADRKNSVGMVHAGLILEDAIALRQSNESFNWIPTAETYTSVRILQVSKIRRPALYQALIDALDVGSWLCFAWSGCFVAGVLSKFLKASVNSSWVSVWWRILILAIDQGGAFATVNWSSKPRLFLGLWLLSLIVITGGYKGVLFSILTKPRRTSVPQTLPELCRATIPVYTLEDYYPDKKTRKSLLEKIIMDFTFKAQDRHLGPATAELAQDLANLKYEFANARTISAFAGDRLYGTSYVPKTGKAYNIKEGKYQGDHILLGNEERINIYLKLLVISGKSYHGRLGPEIQVFLQRSPTLYSGRVVGILMTYGMFQIVESGCWSKWEQEHRHAAILKEIERMQKYLHHENLTAPIVGNPSAIYFDEQTSVEGLAQEFLGDPNRLTLNNFNGPFLMLVVVGFASCIVLIAEWLPVCYCWLRLLRELTHIL